LSRERGERQSAEEQDTQKMHGDWHEGADLLRFHQEPRENDRADDRGALA